MEEQHLDSLASTHVHGHAFWKIYEYVNVGRARLRTYIFNE